MPAGLDPNQITVIALLFGIGAAGLKKLWVFGWVYADKVVENAALAKDRDFWRDIALKSMGHVDKALDKSE
jgi:hypothetical protein